MGKNVIDITCPPFRESDDNEREKSVYPAFWDFIKSTSDELLMYFPKKPLHRNGIIPNWFSEDLLNDRDLEVKPYADSKEVFPTTAISGGIGLYHRKRNSGIGPVGINFDGELRYYENDMLLSINQKIHKKNENSLMDIVDVSVFKYSDLFFEEFPDSIPRNKNKLNSNHFKELEDLGIFYDRKPMDEECYAVWGNQNGANTRTRKWILKKYIEPKESIDKYRVMIPFQNSNGGTIGKVWSEMMVIEPGEIYTKTFCSFGPFETRKEAENLLKYLKSKFQRVVLDSNRGADYIGKRLWKYVPMQNFSNNKDIDWSLNSDELEMVFFCKYNLNNEERNFIKSATEMK